jgi:hypothetical protein
MLPSCEVIDLILEDHKKFLVLMADIVGHTISNVAWSKIRSTLSPVSRFAISDPVSMAPELFEPAGMNVFNRVVFKKRGLIKLYVSYAFKPYEAAGCSEFMLYGGAPLDAAQTVDLFGVSHCMTRAVSNQHNIFSIISIEKDKAADIYSRLMDILDADWEARHQPKP